MELETMRNQVPSIELRRRIRWADADAAGRLYYPRLFDYFGEAEHELLRSLGVPLTNNRDHYDFPRVHVECHFQKPLFLDAPFLLRASVGKLGRTSIRYDFQVFTDDSARELAVAGSVTVVVVRNGKPTAIPSDLRAALTLEKQ